jgi:hypothetical protein
VAFFSYNGATVVQKDASYILCFNSFPTIPMTLSMPKGTMDPPPAIPSSYHLGGTHATRANLKYFQRGVYTVAYDPTSPMRAGARVHSGVEACSFAGRLLYDTFLIAPALLILHFLCALWESLEPALKLHLSALLLALVCTHHRFSSSV